MAENNKAKPNKAAAKRVATTRENQVHLQTRKKASDPKPTKIQSPLVKMIKLTEGQEKFVWEKSEPVSGTNQAIYRRDVAGAIIKINEFNLETEFGWTFVMIDQDGEFDDVNNICAMHWSNARVKRKKDEIWVSKVVGSRDTKDIYNFLKETKVSPVAMGKLRKTNLFQPSVVQRKKISLIIRKDVKK